MFHWRWPLLGLTLATATPFGWHLQTVQRESSAVESMAALRVAQTAFRATNGAGFATEIESLQRPCPGQEAPGAATPASDAVAGYAMTLRGARGGRHAGVDCHGHPTTSDYYAAVAPAPGRSDGRRAFAMTSEGRVFVFFDGIAPTEADMAPGGLAIPLDTLDTFRIP